MPKRTAAALNEAAAAAAADAAASDDSGADEFAGAHGHDDVSPETRERMREAVRKCRQRKRERTERLRNEAVELAKENAMLRTRLEMGSESVNSQKVSRGTSLYKEMVALLINKEQNEDALKHVVELFNERYVEIGRDKMAALKYVAHGLARLLKPADLTTVHLFFLSQDDAFYETDPAWTAMVKYLQLTPEQVAAMLARRAAGRRSKAEVWYAMQRMAALEQAVSEREEVAQRFMGLNVEALKPWQFAQLLSWSHSNPAGKEFLEILWDDLVAKVDAELEVERETQRRTDPDALQVQQTLDQLRLENVREIKRLFTISLENKNELGRIGKKIFAPSGVLIDPSNGGEYNGIEGLLRYVEKMRRAFTSSSNDVEIHFEERAVDVSKDKILAKFFVRGSYMGKLSEGDAPTPASLDSVMAVSFAEGSHLIKEVVVSNDMVGLFLGLGHGEKAEGLVVRNASHPQDHAAVKSQRLEELQRLFETDGDRAAMQLAQRVLTPRCVFVDSNQGTENKGYEECCAYLVRLRRAFPKLAVSSSASEEVSPLTFKCEWNVAAEYGGALAKQQKRPCHLKGVLFVTMEEESCLISSVRMGWDASSLLRELGVCV